ncbi:hypothetical protein SKAU_G00303690 [Synaphobranchus kaupii]|uniref:Uncharacterized protein n=1 Tax=Synaphobranchus kaupii TaxID=118154 RepID=A0A9Q1EW41_SYNKA|nr:hypothetical protein SKAU_G00303690 [Synaphobranchus kaupii]
MNSEQRRTVKGMRVGPRTPGGARLGAGGSLRSLRQGRGYRHRGNFSRRPATGDPRHSRSPFSARSKRSRHPSSWSGTLPPPNPLRKPSPFRRNVRWKGQAQGRHGGPAFLCDFPKAARCPVVGGTCAVSSPIDCQKATSLRGSAGLIQVAEPLLDRGGYVAVRILMPARVGAGWSSLFFAGGGRCFSEWPALSWILGEGVGAEGDLTLRESHQQRRSLRRARPSLAGRPPRLHPTNLTPLGSRPRLTKGLTQPRAVPPSISIVLTDIVQVRDRCGMRVLHSVPGPRRSLPLQIRVPKTALFSSYDK